MTKLNPKLLLDVVYPVGSIYINTTGTNPSTFLGGTWVRFGAGRVLVGQDTSDSSFDTLLETGGEKTHTLTIDEMPSHSHKLLPDGSFTRTTDGSSASGIAFGPKQGTTGLTTESKGGNQAHNNLQPYIVVSMWQRTA